MAAQRMQARGRARAAVRTQTKRLAGSCAIHTPCNIEEVDVRSRICNARLGRMIVLAVLWRLLA